MSAPQTRWARGGAENDGFGPRFAALVAGGEDVDGEARLADALCPRGARVLDAGSGMGRVGAALQARGHVVVGVEPQADLVAQSRATYPDLKVLGCDVLDLDATTLAAHDAPEAFDLVVAVGNVMVFLAEGTETEVLRRLAGLLAPGGRLLVGFHPIDGPSTSRDYDPAEFVHDAAAAGLAVQHRFGSYELHPPREDYAVWVLERAGTPVGGTAVGG